MSHMRAHIFDHVYARLVFSFAAERRGVFDFSGDCAASSSRPGLVYLRKGVSRCQSTRKRRKKTVLLSKDGVNEARLSELKQHCAPPYASTTLLLRSALAAIIYPA